MRFCQDERLYTPKPEYVGRNIIVAIDASKTNSAMFVSDEYGNILNDYEISGDKYDDIYYQTWEQRKFLKTLFEGSHVMLGGIEDIITKDSRGMEEHESRLKITLVYASFISAFQDYCGCTLEPINNWAWKSDILPEKYRTRNHHKGSLDWHKDMHSRYANRKDDITDAWCILQHLLKKHNISKIIHISDDIEDMRQCSYVILSGHTDMAGHVEYRFNKSINLEQNIAFLSNRLKGKNVANFFRVPIGALSIKQIYDKCYGTFSREEREVIIMVFKGS